MQEIILKVIYFERGLSKTRKKASQFMTSQIIPLPFVFLYLESVERKGKNYKSLNISRTK